MKPIRFYALAAAVVAGLMSLGAVLMPLNEWRQSPKTSFGEMAVAEIQPVTAWTFAYNINTDMVTTSTLNAGSVSQADGMAILSTGVATNGQAKINSVRRLGYIPGVGGLVRFTAVFSDGCKANSTQIIGIGDDSDGLFLGCDGADFGVMRRQNGTDYWTDTPGIVDVTKGVPYQIQYQWLGFGMIRWYYEDKGSGEFVLMHSEQYANSNSVPSIYNPSLPLMAEVKNTGNTTSLELLTASAMAGREGSGIKTNHPLRFERTAVVTRSSVTTESVLLVISNSTTYQGQNNRIQIQLDALAVAVEGTKPVSIRGVLNCTAGSALSFSAFNATTSPAYTSTTIAAISGGSNMFGWNLAKSDSMVADMSQYSAFLQPGDRLCIVAKSDNASQVELSATWGEDY